jgi:capsular polysaccharide transport system permease protein
VNAPLRPRRGAGRGLAPPPAAEGVPALAAAGPPTAASHLDLLFEIARRRRRRTLWRFAAFVILPTLATAAYFAFLAAPRYVSHAELTYSIYRPPESLSAGLAQSFSGTNQNNNIDLGAIVYQYARSDAILHQLERSLPLRQAFSSPRLDPLTRLSPDAADSELLRAYRRRVTVSEGLGGYLTLDVATADPQLSQRLAQAVVNACDRMVDDITAHARDDEMSFASAEVAREEDRVRRARAALTRFQNQHGTEDPERSANQISGVAGVLESDLAAARAQLAENTPFLSSASPAIRQLHARITSLEGQLAAENARLADTSGTPFSQLLDEYSRLQLEQEFARTAYTQAEQGLAVARADAARRENYLVPFIAPSLPDRPDLIAPIEMTASVFLAAVLASVMLSVLGGALRDGSGL